MRVGFSLNPFEFRAGLKQIIYTKLDGEYVS